MHVGKIIAKRLDKLGRKPIWLASEIGTSEAAVLNWIEGKNHPNSKYIPTICEKLKISTEQLFGKKYL